ncbi:hypothetical protein Bca52824_089838 [Brassica carinata]|uniref:Uncharacterized protein n=1 Tax=Brassica carinata TaxID=52824 RepID=A0A8X7NVQ9_BRACI|nr:hypothetical protein Bca52824_089838 [Brassica carinata]
MSSRNRRDLKGKAEVFLCFQLIVQHVMEYGEDKEDVWGISEIFDRKVANMVELLKAGHKFKNHEWGGGDAAEPKSCGQTSVYMLQHEDEYFWHDIMIFSDLLGM